MQLISTQVTGKCSEIASNGTKVILLNRLFHANFLSLVIEGIPEESPSELFRSGYLRSCSWGFLEYFVTLLLLMFARAPILSKNELFLRCLNLGELLRATWDSLQVLPSSNVTCSCPS